MEIVLIIIGIPIALGIFSILRSKVDPDYKQRVDASIKTRKELRDRGYNDSMINNEIKRRDQLYKSEKEKDANIIEFENGLNDANRKISKYEKEISILEEELDEAKEPSEIKKLTEDHGVLVDELTRQMILRDLLQKKLNLI